MALFGTAGAWLTPLPAGLAAPGTGPQTTKPSPAAAVPLELELSADNQRYDAQLGRYVATGRVKVLPSDDL